MNSSRIQPIDSALVGNQNAELAGDGGQDKQSMLAIAPLVPSTGSVLPSKRGGATLTQVRDGKVYLIGGADREASSFGDVHAFDLGRQHPIQLIASLLSTPSHLTHVNTAATSEWRLIVPSHGSLPPRSGHSTVAVGHALIVFGGFNAREGLVYNDIHVFDTDTRAWTQVTAEGDAPTPRNAHAAVLVPSDSSRRQPAMLVFGGSSPHHGAFDDAFLLHMDGDDAVDQSVSRSKFRWEKLDCSGEQPEARELHCGVSVSDSSVCFLGGRNRHGSMCTDMAYLDTSSWVWQVVPMCGWARCSHAAGLVGGVLTSFGGFDGTSVCDDSWQFCDQVDEWRLASCSEGKSGLQTVPERFGHCGAAIVVPTAALDREKMVSGSDEQSNNTDLESGGLRALLVFGGMNAEDDLNDLVLVTPQC